MNTKGIKTTEFWVDIVTAAVIVFDKHLGLDLSPTVTALAASLAAIYTICRSWTKR